MRNIDAFSSLASANQDEVLLFHQRWPLFFSREHNSSSPQCGKRILKEQKFRIVAPCIRNGTFLP